SLPVSRGESIGGSSNRLDVPTQPGTIGAETRCPGWCWKGRIGMTCTPATDMLLKSLRPFIEPAEQPHGFSPDEARELLEDCEIPAAILERQAWRVKKLWDLGVERRELVCAHRDFLGVLERCARAFDDARAKVPSPGSEGQPQPASLAKAIAAAAEIREWVT